MSGTGKSRGTKELARRRAALERVAARMAEERRAAQEAEEARRRREARLDELAADFELAAEDAGRVAEEVEEEVLQVRARGEERLGAARLVAARVVVAMGEAGETVAGCGRRLGVGAERVKELRRLARDADAEADGAAAGSVGRGPGGGGSAEPGGPVAFGAQGVEGPVGGAAREEGTAVGVPSP